MAAPRRRRRALATKTALALALLAEQAGGDRTAVVAAHAAGHARRGSPNGSFDYTNLGGWGESQLVGVDNVTQQVTSKLRPAADSAAAASDEYAHVLRALDVGFDTLKGASHDLKAAIRDSEHRKVQEAREALESELDGNPAAGTAPEDASLPKDPGSSTTRTPATAAEHAPSECDWDACLTFTKETAGGREAFWEKCAKWCCDDKDASHSPNVLVAQECRTH